MINRQTYDPTQHNYVRKLLALFERGEIPPTGLTHTFVAHDDWCEINQGGYCNCDPDVTLLAPERN